MDRTDHIILTGLVLVVTGLVLALGIALAGEGGAAPLAAVGCLAAAWAALVWQLVRLTRHFKALKRTLDQQQRRLEHEMALAAKVHNSLIPPATQRAGPFRIDVRYLPLQQIGGDMTTFHVDAQRAVARVGIGDVTGHGTSAALLVNRIHHEADDLLRLSLPPEEILRRINRLVWRTFGGTDMLMTFTVVEVDVGAGRVRWANGGHPPPLLWHAATGAISLLTAQATLLGISDDLGLDPLAEDFPLGRGDRLVLHTDGLIDALDPAGRRFGMDRLIALVREVLAARRGSGVGDRWDEPGRTGAEIVQRVRQYARAPLQDDVLVVTVAVDTA